MGPSLKKKKQSIAGCQRRDLVPKVVCRLWLSTEASEEPTTHHHDACSMQLIAECRRASTRLHTSHLRRQVSPRSELRLLYAFFWVIPRHLNSDAGVLPRRKNITFRTRRKFEIKKNCDSFKYQFIFVQTVEASGTFYTQHTNLTRNPAILQIHHS